MRVSKIYLVPSLLRWNAQSKEFPQLFLFPSSRWGNVCLSKKIYIHSNATLRFLESEEFKDFVRTFKRVMRSMNDRLENISRYSFKILEVSKQGFSEANADRDMSEYYAQQHRKWQKNMQLRDKGYE